jgi:hypothetical protein
MIDLLAIFQLVNHVPDESCRSSRGDVDNHQSYQTGQCLVSFLHCVPQMGASQRVCMKLFLDLYMARLHVLQSVREPGSVNVHTERNANL